jgi:hypothetical protein
MEQDVAELDSLYLRVRISKEAYLRYLDSINLDARDFSDWMDWIGRAKMHGPPMTAQDVAEIGETTGKAPVAETINSWTEDDFAIGRSVYDEATETWRFGVLQFGENYRDFLEWLPTLRGIDRFKDRPGTDILLVHDFLIRSSEYIVLLEIGEGTSRIAGSPGQEVPFPIAYAKEANAFLTDMIPE